MLENFTTRHESSREGHWKLRTSNRKWHGQGKQEVWGRAVMLFHCVFFPVRSHSLARRGTAPGRERKERGGRSGESRPPSPVPLVAPSTLNCSQTADSNSASVSPRRVGLLWRFTSDTLISEAASCQQMVAVLLLSVCKTLDFKIVCDSSALLLLESFTGWTETCLRWDNAAACLLEV